jgi:RNA-splicing ligase RtcB
MYSTVHGAGRVMSRTEAAGKINRKTGEIKSPGKVSWPMLREWLEPMGVVLRRGGLDESPQAYQGLRLVRSSRYSMLTKADRAASRRVDSRSVSCASA